MFILVLVSTPCLCPCAPPPRRSRLPGRGAERTVRVFTVRCDHGKKVLDVHPEITTWVAGGHSLGGVTAATFADQDERVKGLALFASYPADNIVRADLKVLSSPEPRTD